MYVILLIVAIITIAIVAIGIAYWYFMMEDSESDSGSEIPDETFIPYREPNPLDQFSPTIESPADEFSNWSSAAR